MSSELPTNLQIIKLEELNGASERSNIKERLNLHVKRRLQQEVIEPFHIDSGFIATAKKSCKPSPMPAATKEVQKLRKPYQKRVERIKPETNNKGRKVQAVIPSAADSEIFDEPVDHESESLDSKNLSRDRYKSADILYIVLGTKKQALLSNPQVQSFWSKITSALKN